MGCSICSIFGLVIAQVDIVSPFADGFSCGFRLFLNLLNNEISFEKTSIVDI